MEAEVTYIAKDGRRFTDALQCEAYEKSIGIPQGSVASLIQELEKAQEEQPDCKYVNGVVAAYEGSSFPRLCHFTTMPFDNDTEESDPLIGEKSLSVTVDDAIRYLRKRFQDDAPCQYMLWLSKCITCWAGGPLLMNYNTNMFLLLSKKREEENNQK